MHVLTALCFALTALVLAVAGHQDHQSASVSAGDPCTPRYASTCGERTVMSVQSTPAGANYGPNVCQFEEMFQANTFTYEWQQYCTRYGWGYRRYCWFSCVSTGECNGTATNVTKRYTSCCDGYASRPSSADSDFYWRHHRHRNSFLRSEGCPIRLMDTVLDCLDHLNLTEFLSLVEGTSLEATLNMTDTSFTIFAPTNEVLALLSGLTQDELEDLLSTHIVEKTIPDSKLLNGAVFTPLDEETLLHVTDVYEYSGWGYFQWRSSETSFINGAEVIQKDACQATNGIVHVVDSLIPTSSRSITEILEDDNAFDTFKELLDAAGISDYLNQSNPRTVIAPTETAFDAFGSTISECLQEEENLRALKYLLLIHVGYPVEYTSSLSLRNHIPTFSGFYLRVQDINDTVHLTRNEIPLDKTDISARNGVIHSIDELIVPPCLNLTALCPPPQPPPLVLPSPSPVFPSVVDGSENPEQPLEDLSPDDMPPGVEGDV